MSHEARRACIFTLFLLSGAAALVYEVAWMRHLGLVLGTAAVSVTVVLAAFMGGLALGSAAGAALVARTRRPLVLYGFLEVGLGAAALALPALLPHLRPLPEAAGLAAACALLLVPTAVMGATFPIMCAALRDEAARAPGGRAPDAGRGRSDAARLYGINTLGATLGTASAAFLLLPALGLSATNLLAVALSTGVGVAALGLAALGALGARRRRAGAGGAWGKQRLLAPAAGAGGPAADGADGADGAPPAGPWRLLALAALLSGFSGLLLEVVHARVLAMVLGGSVYAFATMLSAFLVGIGAGSLAAGALARRAAPRRAAAGAAAVLAATAALTIGTGWMLPELPWLFVQLFRAIGPSPLTEAALAALVLVPPALGLGASFALLLRAVGGERSPRRAGQLYAANTVGAVGGALAGGLWLVPLLGLSQALALAATAQLIAAALAAGRLRWLLLAALLCAPAFALRPALPPSVLATGAYAYAGTLDPEVDRRAFYEQFEGGRIDLVYAADGRHSTVTVERFPHVNTVYLKNNGKVEGSAPIDPDAPSHADMTTQVSLAAAPLALHEAPRRALVIGLGGGVTLGAALAFPVEALDLIEIEGRVVDAVRRTPELGRESERALLDPRLSVHVTDARRFLELAPPGGYDVIVSQPSDPWLTGVANLFTREMFAAARRALAPDGLFCQWVQLYGLDEEGLAVLLRTFADELPHIAVMRPAGAREMLLIGSRAPIELDLDAIDARLGAEGPRRFLERAALWPPERFHGQWVAATARIRAFAAGAQPSTDDRNTIEFLAPRTRFTPPEVGEALVQRLLRDTEGPAPLMPGLRPARRLAVAAGALEVGNPWAAEAHLRALPPEPEARIGAAPLYRELGDLMLRSGDEAGAILFWMDALRADPGDRETFGRVVRFYQALQETR